MPKTVNGPKKKKIALTTKIVQNSPKLPNTAKKSRTTAKIDQNGKKCPNSPKWSKQLKMAKTGQNGQDSSQWPSFN